MKVKPDQGEWYIAGAPNHPGTCLPTNVTGDCPHKHRTPEAARRCIARMDRAIKRGHGPAAYCDRMVIRVVDGRKVEVVDSPGPWRCDPVRDDDGRVIGARVVGVHVGVE